jgi:hypothetical protein
LVIVPAEDESDVVSPAAKERHTAANTMLMTVNRLMDCPFTCVFPA